MLWHTSRAWSVKGNKGWRIPWRRLGLEAVFLVNVSRPPGLWKRARRYLLCRVTFYLYNCILNASWAARSREREEGPWLFHYNQIMLQLILSLDRWPRARIGPGHVRHATSAGYTPYAVSTNTLWVCSRCAEKANSYPCRSSKARPLHRGCCATRTVQMTPRVTLYVLQSVRKSVRGGSIAHTFCVQYNPLKCSTRLLQRSHSSNKIMSTHFVPFKTALKRILLQNLTTATETEHHYSYSVTVN